jgi:hypothetical protein
MYQTDMPSDKPLTKAQIMVNIERECGSLRETQSIIWIPNNTIPTIVPNKSLRSIVSVVDMIITISMSNMQIIDNIRTNQKVISMRVLLEARARSNLACLSMFCKAGGGASTT